MNSFGLSAGCDSCSFKSATIQMYCNDLINHGACRCFISPLDPSNPTFSQSLCTDNTRPATPIPPILARIGQRIAADLNVNEFHQLTVNTYKPGEV